MPEADAASTRAPTASNLAGRSQALFERASRVMPGGVGRGGAYMTPHPVYVDSAKGCWFTDLDGVERIDFSGNYTAMIHGYAHPEIDRAVMRQIPKGTSFALATESELELAEILCERVASIEKIRFLNSGTEAVMLAIQGARAYTGRPKVAKCEGAYHGMYDYMETNLDSPPVAFDSDNDVVKPAIEGLTAGVRQDVVVFPFNQAKIAEQVLARHAEELAAVVVDLMPNRAGQVPMTREFAEMLRGFCDRHGVVLIADEVLTFRLGYHGAQAEFGLDADMTVLGKIIGGGFPVGALGGRDRFMAVFDPTGGKPAVYQSGTFSANPVTMVAGAAAMRLLTPPEFDRLNDLGERARKGLRGAFKDTGVPGCVTGMGSLLRLHMTGRDVRDYASYLPSDAERERLARLWRFLFDRGVYLANTGMAALSTPMGEVEIDSLVDTVAEGLRELK